MSKQPQLKGGAVRIEKCQHAEALREAGSVQVATNQISTRAKLAQTKPDARKITDARKRQRQLELWVCASYESVRILQQAITNLIPNLVNDFEIQSSLRVLQQINEDTANLLKPYADRCGSYKTYGHEISQHLRDSLLPSAKSKPGPYEAMVTLTGLHVYMGNIDAHLTALAPVAQAMWDKEFEVAVTKATNNTAKMQKWAMHQLTVRSAQTLVVPSVNILDEDGRWLDGK